MTAGTGKKFLGCNTSSSDIGSPYVTALSLWAFCHGLIQIASTKRAQIEHEGTPVAQFVEHAFGLALRALRP